MILSKENYMGNTKAIIKRLASLKKTFFVSLCLTVFFGSILCFSQSAYAENTLDISAFTVKTNPDGTQKVKFVTQYADGNLSNIKTSTLFLDCWSNEKIINSIKTVGDSSPIGVRTSDGAMLHRDIIDGVQIEVIKVGDTVTSGYPTGGVKTGLLPGFSSLE